MHSSWSSMIVPITSIKIFEQEQKKKKKRNLKLYLFIVTYNCIYTSPEKNSVYFTNPQLQHLTTMHIYLTRKKLSIFYKSTVATFDDHAFLKVIGT